MLGAGSWMFGFRFAKEIPRFARNDSDGIRYEDPNDRCAGSGMLGAGCFCFANRFLASPGMTEGEIPLRLGRLGMTTTPGMTGIILNDMNNG